ncbi:hypothetical protein GQ105_005559 [Salmonella enterica]|nr:hypothetical protein [Salmonella enterica]
MQISEARTLIVKATAIANDNLSVSRLDDVLTKIIEFLTDGKYTRASVANGTCTLEKIHKHMENSTLRAKCGTEVVPNNSGAHRLVGVTPGTVLRTITLDMEGKKIKISKDENNQFIVKLPKEPWVKVESPENRERLQTIIEGVYDGEDLCLKPIKSEFDEGFEEWVARSEDILMTDMGKVYTSEDGDYVRYMQKLQKADAKIRLIETKEPAGSGGYTSDVPRSVNNKIIVNGLELPKDLKQEYTDVIMSIIRKEGNGKSTYVTKIDNEKGEKLLTKLKNKYGEIKGTGLYNALTSEATVKSYIIGTDQGTQSAIYKPLVRCTTYDRGEGKFTVHPEKEIRTERNGEPIITNGSDYRTTIINTKEKNGVITEATTELSIISGCSRYQPFMNGIIEDGEDMPAGLARTTITTKVTSTDALDGKLEDTKVTRNGWATALSVKELAEVM